MPCKGRESALKEQTLKLNKLIMIGFEFVCDNGPKYLNQETVGPKIELEK